MFHRNARRLALGVVLAGALLAPGAAATAAPAAIGLDTKSVPKESPFMKLPFVAVVTPVDRTTADAMRGVSWKEGCPVPIEDLRLVHSTYRGFDDRVHWGRMAVHHDVAARVVRALGKMYHAQFPIRRMELVDVYGGNDDLSMAADNTSAFNCRPKTGIPGQWSVHSYGRAIDINPVENPYVKGNVVLPPAGSDYLDRADVRPGMITLGDVVEQAFTTEGFTWGGNWRTLKDYQHFERPAP
jgi:D-alanyl-D-alanine carboxypeptidase